MYSFSSRVRYSEINRRRELDLFSIVNYFQDCSTFQSEDIGVGLEFLESRHRAWLMNSWQIVLCRYPALCENITVSTWPYGFKGIYGYRNFLMKDEWNRVCAYANSIWVFVDTTTGRPVRCKEEEMAAYRLEPPYDMECAPRKILLPDSLKPQAPFAVIPSDIDTNNHVNNGQYIRMAQEFLPDGFIIGQMRAEYRSPAVLNDIIYPESCLQTTETGKSLCTIALANSDKKPYAVVEFTSA